MCDNNGNFTCKNIHIALKILCILFLHILSHWVQRQIEKVIGITLLYNKRKEFREVAQISRKAFCMIN